MGIRVLIGRPWRSWLSLHVDTKKSWCDTQPDGGCLPDESGGLGTKAALWAGTLDLRPLGPRGRNVSVSPQYFVITTCAD